MVPTHGNPTGATLPPRARERLVRLAGEHGFFILADEVYQLLDWTPPGGGGGGAGGEAAAVDPLLRWPRPEGGPPERLRAFDRATAGGREFAAADLEDDPLVRKVERISFCVEETEQSSRKNSAEAYPPGCLQGVAKPGSPRRLKAVPGASVVSLNAFTKILAPGEAMMRA